MNSETIDVRQTFVNAIMSVIQFAVLGLSMFFLYRFLIDRIGVAQLGLWSLVISVTSASSVADLGLAGGVVKFAAQYAAVGEHKRINLLIETSLLSIGLILAIALPLMFPVFRYVLGRVLKPSDVISAQQILPWVMVTFWISALARVFQAGLDGSQRIDIRSFFQTVNNGLLYPVLCVLLVPRYQLMGLAAAYLIRSMTLLLGNRILLQFVLDDFPIVPHHWSRELFRKTLRYGISIQIISVARMLFDPVTKSLLAKFGGLDMSGYYEMAYQMVTQLRGVLVSANSVLVPVIANLQQRTSNRVSEVYQSAFRLLVFLSFPFYGLIAALLPATSVLWIGRFEPVFVISGYAIAIAYLVNTMCGPAYFTNMGTGELRDNVISHAIMSGMNVGLGYTLGRLFSGYGVIIAWALAVCLGSIYLLVRYPMKHSVTFAQLFTKEDGLLTAMSILLASGCVFLSFYAFADHLPPVLHAVAVAAIFGFGLLIPVWRHPMRSRTLTWLGSLVPSGSS